MDIAEIILYLAMLFALFSFVHHDALKNHRASLKASLVVAVSLLVTSILNLGESVMWVQLAFSVVWGYMAQRRLRWAEAEESQLASIEEQRKKRLDDFR